MTLPARGIPFGRDHVPLDCDGQRSHSFVAIRATSRTRWPTAYRRLPCGSTATIVSYVSGTMQWVPATHGRGLSSARIARLPGMARTRAGVTELGCRAIGSLVLSGVMFHGAVGDGAGEGLDESTGVPKDPGELLPLRSR